MGSEWIVKIWLNYGRFHTKNAKSEKNAKSTKGKRRFLSEDHDEIRYTLCFEKINLFH